MKINSPFKRVSLGLLVLATIAATLTCIDYFGGHNMGLFSGTRPDGLGFADGKFKLPAWKPNCVSSTVEKTDAHYIAPISFSGDGPSALAKVASIIKSSRRAQLIRQRPDYLYAEYKSAGMGFIDDVEFSLDAKVGVIHVRSASRLGIGDLGVNRQRIEQLRAQMAAK